VPPVMFRTFNNAHDGYGSFEDLESATLEDAESFFYSVSTCCVRRATCGVLHVRRAECDVPSRATCPHVLRGTCDVPCAMPECHGCQPAPAAHTL
jgi:hypothetical protein